MTKKAQEIRKNRKAMINQDIYEEAKKVFDWILELIDEDTKAKRFKDLELYMFNSESVLRTKFDGGKEYNLKNFLLRHDRIKLFEVLKEIIEREEGFAANYKQTKVWDSPCIIFQIVIK